MKIGRLTVLVLAAMLVLACLAGTGSAEVNVNVGVFAPPPAYVVPAPPEVVVIPGTYVYYAPGLDVDILFFHGYWWRPYEGRWYRAKHYNGPWGFVRGERVPREIVGLPHDYRHMPPGHERIPYGQLKKNWRGWEKERHWDRHEEKHEMRGERGDRGEQHGHGDRGEGHGERGEGHGRY